MEPGRVARGRGVREGAAAMRAKGADSGAALVRDAPSYFARGRCSARRHVPARMALATLGVAMALAGLALVPAMQHGDALGGLFAAGPPVGAIRPVAGTALVACAMAREFAWARRAALSVGLLFGALALVGGAGVGSVVGIARVTDADMGLQALACVWAMGVWALTDAGMETAWLTRG